LSNIIADIKIDIKNIVRTALEAAVTDGEFREFDVPGIDEIFVESPKEKNNGDFSCSAAMKLAGPLRRAPAKIAQIVISKIVKSEFIEKVECAGPGFINFYLNDLWLRKAIVNVQNEGIDYGKVELGKGQKINVEFVSANPTGPLHMGNARGGALGDCVAGVLEMAGYDVTREFYLNDAGNQILKLQDSLNARYIQLLKGDDAIEFPEDGYFGEDITEHMRAFIEINGDRYLDVDEGERKKVFSDFALGRNVEAIRSGLSQYGIEFDIWYPESDIYNSGEVEDTIKILRDKGHTYEEDGALWLKLTELGADKDEVMIRSNGIPTYMAVDIAYHRNKLEKRKFDKAIDFWGADHHGHAGRMKYAMQALGIDPDRLEIVIFQLVRLIQDGEIVRMSKRTGKAVSLGDLLEDTGVDAARFFFNLKTAGSHMDFDLDLAVKQSNDNPVFYVQYAHARICSILRVLGDAGVSVEEVTVDDLAILTMEEELALMNRLAKLPEEITAAANSLEPSILTRYVIDVAADFHSFYNACRIKGEAPEIIKARLALVNCTKTVIRNVLSILKITAPEKM
jgi:arginyl-tRNA synthetase